MMIQKDVMGSLWPSPLRLRIILELIDTYQMTLQQFTYSCTDASSFQWLQRRCLRNLESISKAMIKAKVENWSMIRDLRNALYTLGGGAKKFCSRQILQYRNLIKLTPFFKMKTLSSNTNLLSLFYIIYALLGEPFGMPLIPNSATSIHHFIVDAKLLSTHEFFKLENRWKSPSAKSGK